jgi:hypothetical protein
VTNNQINLVTKKRLLEIWPDFERYRTNALVLVAAPHPTSYTNHWMGPDGNPRSKNSVRERWSWNVSNRELPSREYARYFILVELSERPTSARVVIKRVFLVPAHIALKRKRIQTYGGRSYLDQFQVHNVDLRLAS